MAGDLLRYLIVGLWSLTVMVMVAAVLGYLDARRRGAETGILTEFQVGLYSASYIVSITANTSTVVGTLGRPVSGVLWVTLLALIAGDVALWAIIRAQRARVKRMAR